MQKIPFRDIPDCIRLENGEVELVLSTGVGPRILCYAFVGGQNHFAEGLDTPMQTALGAWVPRGGHRLWVAPERLPGSYAPDSVPVQVLEHGPRSVTLVQPPDAAGFEKSISVTLEDAGTRVEVTHQIRNHNAFPVEIAPWALSIVRPGTVLIPQEPYRSHDDDLQATRTLTLWSFTNLADPRWRFGQRFIRLTADPALEEAQKIGALNRQGYSAHHADGELFITRFAPASSQPGVRYADMGCNNETYTAGAFMEMESLGPLETVDVGGTVTHRELWSLHRDFALEDDDGALEARIRALLS